MIVLHVHAHYHPLYFPPSLPPSLSLTPSPSHSTHELQRSGTSGSVDASDLHSTYRSGSSTASLVGSRTPRKAPSESLDSTPSLLNTPRKASGLSSNAGSWHATTATPDARQLSSLTMETVPLTMRALRENERAMLDVPPAVGGASHLLFSQLRCDLSDSQSATSEMERLLSADEEIDNPEPTDDVMSLLGATKRQTWHYKKSKEMCANLASLESMGMCKLETDHVTFDPSRSYTSPTNDVSPPSTNGEEVGSPCRIESFDSLYDLAGNSNTFSRNSSSNSIGPALPGTSGCPQQPSLLSSSLPHHPSPHSHPHLHHRSPTHQICGSIDSGYSNDNSIDVSSLTDSSHTGMNDSLLTGPRFSIELNAGKHCHPECSNIFMKSSERLAVESKTPVVHASPLKLHVAKMAPPHHLHIEADDESLRDELERTAMKRQQSDVSGVSSTCVRPPTTHRSDTLDSNTTPVGGGSDAGESVDGDDGGGDTLTRRRRSGAFSYHSRSTRASVDDSTLDSRDGSKSTLERDARGPLDVKRLAKQRGRQVAGKTVEEEEEDDVFSHLSRSPDPPRSGSGSGGVCRCSVSPCPPEVRVSCSPPPLASCWIEGDSSDSEPPLPFSTNSSPVSGDMCSQYALRTYTCTCTMYIHHVHVLHE